MRQTLEVFEDLEKGRVQVLHPAVDVFLVVLNEVHDSSVMDNRVIQTRNTRPQTGHMTVQP